MIVSHKYVTELDYWWEFIWFCISLIARNKRMIDAKVDLSKTKTSDQKGNHNWIKDKAKKVLNMYGIVKLFG